MSDWDVIVVGSGPSGSVSAGLLADLGYSVLMLERAEHPRPKPCGEFINPGAVSALRRTGFADAVEALEPARIRGWRIRTWQGADIEASFNDGSPEDDLEGWGLPRMRVDATLATAAQERGATLHERRTVTTVEADARGVRVESRGPDTRVDRARFLLGADGLRSIVARQLGASSSPGARRRVSLSAHVSGHGPDPSTGWLRLGGSRTVGLAALDPKGRRWNATVVVDPQKARARIKADAEAFFGDVLRDAGLPWESGPDLIAGPWASGPFERPTRTISGPSWALVGDAAGYFDPLTGQGVHQAVRSAELAAECLHAALLADASSRGLPDYARRLQRELTPVRRVQRVVASVVESDLLGRAVFPRLEAVPGSASALIRVTGDWSRSRSLFRPRVWAPLLRPRSRSHPHSPESA